jgi:hypothetical protein
MNASEIKTVFGDIENILTSHQQFLTQLDKCVATWSFNSDLGPALKSLSAPALYSAYINNFNTAQTILQGIFFFFLGVHNRICV